MAQEIDESKVLPQILRIQQVKDYFESLKHPKVTVVTAPNDDNRSPLLGTLVAHFDLDHHDTEMTYVKLLGAHSDLIHPKYFYSVQVIVINRCAGDSNQENIYRVKLSIQF